MKDDKVYLQHLAESIRKVRQYTNEGRDAFFKDQKTQDAVIRNLEVIGEAVKQLSETFRALHPELPWKQIAGMRDKLFMSISELTSCLSGMSWKGTCQRLNPACFAD